VLEHAAGDQVVEQHAHGGHVLLEGGGRQAIGLGGFQVVTDVERADVLHALLAAVLQEGEGRAQRPLDAVARLAAGGLRRWRGAGPRWDPTQSGPTQLAE
jgi:hypothetical protein